MKFTKKGKATERPIDTLCSGDLFASPNEPDIYMFLEGDGLEGVNLATGEVEKFVKFMNVIPIDGELVWNYSTE